MTMLTVCIRLLMIGQLGDSDGFSDVGLEDWWLNPGSRKRKMSAEGTVERLAKQRHL